MRRQRNSETSDTFDYLLTDQGRDLAGVITALIEWGDRWAAPNGPPILYAHATCDGPINTQLRCANCGAVRDPNEVYVHPGPGMPPDIAANMRARPARTSDPT